MLPWYFFHQQTRQNTFENFTLSWLAFFILGLLFIFVTKNLNHCAKDVHTFGLDWIPLQGGFHAIVVNCVVVQIIGMEHCFFFSDFKNLYHR